MRYAPCMFIGCGHYHQEAGEICTMLFIGCGHYHQEAGEICTMYVYRVWSLPPGGW